jgi:hypothetical protein
MKKSELRQLIRQVIKEQLNVPNVPNTGINPSAQTVFGPNRNIKQLNYVKRSKPKKDLKLDPRIKVPGFDNMAQPKSASSGCHPSARKVKLRNCFSGITAQFDCAVVNGDQVPVVGQMIDASSFVQNSIVPRQIISVEPAGTNQNQNPNLILYPDQTATECGYDCLGAEGNYLCQFNGDGTAEFDTLQSCVSSCVPPDPCKDIMNDTMVDLNNNLIAGGATYGDTMVGVQGQTLYSEYPGGIVTVGYCRACNQGAFTSGYYTNNPEIHNQLMSMPSPSPSFATNQDVCNEMQANGCCGIQTITNTSGGVGGSV